jgi:hypothetical protein
MTRTTVQRSALPLSPWRTFTNAAGDIFHMPGLAAIDGQPVRAAEPVAPAKPSPEVAATLAFRAAHPLPSDSPILAQIAGGGPVNLGTCPMPRDGQRCGRPVITGDPFSDEPAICTDCRDAVKLPARRRRATPKASTPRQLWHVHRDSEWAGPKRSAVQESDEPPYDDSHLAAGLRWASAAKWGALTIWSRNPLDVEAVQQQATALGYRFTNIKLAEGRANYRCRVEAIAAKPAIAPVCANPGDPVVQATLMPAIVPAKVARAASLVQAALW